MRRCLWLYYCIYWYKNGSKQTIKNIYKKSNAIENTKVICKNNESINQFFFLSEARTFALIWPMIFRCKSLCVNLASANLLSNILLRLFLLKTPPPPPSYSKSNSSTSTPSCFATTLLLTSGMTSAVTSAVTSSACPENVVPRTRSWTPVWDMSTT